MNTYNLVVRCFAENLKVIIPVTHEDELNYKSFNSTHGQPAVMKLAHDPGFRAQSSKIKLKDPRGLAIAIMSTADPVPGQIGPVDWWGIGFWDAITPEMLLQTVEVVEQAAVEAGCQLDGPRKFEKLLLTSSSHSLGGGLISIEEESAMIHGPHHLITDELRLRPGEARAATALYDDDDDDDEDMSEEEKLGTYDPKKPLSAQPMVFFIEYEDDTEYNIFVTTKAFWDKYDCIYDQHTEMPSEIPQYEFGGRKPGFDVEAENLWSYRDAKGNTLPWQEARDVLLHYGFTEVYPPKNDM